MKLRRVVVENFRSFLHRQELVLDGDISILIGPNGGGKTNLLEAAIIALRYYLMRSWTIRSHSDSSERERYEWVANDDPPSSLLEKHSQARNERQLIEVHVEVTKRDIENMSHARDQALALYEKSKARYVGFPSSNPQRWNPSEFKPGDQVAFQIINGHVQVPATEKDQSFLQFLDSFEVISRLREEDEQLPLSLPMLSLPVNRSIDKTSASVSLAKFNEFDMKRAVDGATSRSLGSIMSFAIARLAQRLRDLLEVDNGRAMATLLADDAIDRFTTFLRTLGYEWSLQCDNTSRNQYSIRLVKQGTPYNFSVASSGEKELLTYLFAIYALNVRDALIVIDEPELHLHPRWQRILLDMFERLAAETGNQFLLATHSPVFVAPHSIQYATRVYAEEQTSRLVQLNGASLPDQKHLFSIVNSQNNERIFFADLVILVEGISDRIFFDALFRHFKIGEGVGRTHEIVSVGGKSVFPQYRLLLEACQVQYVIIADLDYVRDIGTSEQLRQLFSVSHTSIHRNVIADTTSNDGATLVAELDAAIQTGSLESLRPLWEYIRSRQMRLREDLSKSERELLDTFIAEQREQGIAILSRGPLESYLPSGYRRKDIEQLIRLVAEPQAGAQSFMSLLPREVLPELKIVADLVAWRLGPHSPQDGATGLAGSADSGVGVQPK
jgi:putative ATP-dependent endonuclease of the OLD family